MAEVIVTIVSFNKRDLLRECLRSLKAQTFRDFVLYLIDSGSTDQTAEMVAYEYPEAKLYCLKENSGFAYPYNLAITAGMSEHPEAKYIIALNNDTKCDPRYLEEMVSAAKRHPEAGSIQPKLVNYFDQKVIDCVGMLIHPDMSAINRGQKEVDRGQYDVEEETFGASGSAALYRREALEAVAEQANPKLIQKCGAGGIAAPIIRDYFDSDYFAYYEDVDLAWRLRLKGYESWYAPRAVVWHVHSATGVNSSPFKAFHIHRNLYYNMIKDLPGLFLCRALFLMPIRYFLSVVSVLRGKGNSARLASNSKRDQSIARIVWKTWREVLKNRDRLWQKRRQIQRSRKVSAGEIANWFRKYHASWSKIIFG